MEENPNEDFGAHSVKDSIPPNRRRREESAFCSSVFTLVKNLFIPEEMSDSYDSSTLKDDDSDTQVELPIEHGKCDRSTLIDQQPPYIDLAADAIELDAMIDNPWRRPMLIDLVSDDSNDQGSIGVAKMENEQLAIPKSAGDQQLSFKIVNDQQLIADQQAIVDDETDPKSIKSDWAGLKPKILKKIFQYITVTDVYFCGLVCPNWTLAAKAYFDSNTVLNWRQLVHNPVIKGGVNGGVARLCSLCFQVALFHMPKLVKIDLRFSSDIRKVSISDNAEFRHLVTYSLDKIEEIRFVNRLMSAQIIHFMQLWGPPSIRYTMG